LFVDYMLQMTRQLTKDDPAAAAPLRTEAAEPD
jgi:hypothetical protein